MRQNVVVGVLWNMVEKMGSLVCGGQNSLKTLFHSIFVENVHFLRIWLMERNGAAVIVTSK